MTARSITAKDVNALTGRVSPGESRGAETPYELIRRLEARFACWLRYRTTVSQLSDLTDRGLADIGIPRGEIRTVARNAARQAGA